MAITPCVYTIEAFASTALQSSAPTTTSGAPYNYFGGQADAIQLKPITGSTVSLADVYSIVYVVRIWKTATAVNPSSPGASTTPHSEVNSDGAGVYSYSHGGDFKNWVDSIKKIATVSDPQTVHGGAGAFGIQPLDGDHHPRYNYVNGDSFYIVVTPKSGASGFINKPAIRPYLKPNSTLNTSSTDYPLTTMLSGNSIPAVTYTAAKSAVGTPPPEYTADRTKSGVGGWSACTGLWSVIRLEHANVLPINSGFAIYIATYDQWQLKSKVAVIDKKSKDNILKGKKNGLDGNGNVQYMPDTSTQLWKDAVTQLNNLINCIPAKQKGPSGPTGPGGSNNSSKDTGQDQASVLTNPPLHKLTRPGSDLFTLPKRAYFYSDFQSAATLKSNKGYAFHFHYNPTSIQYGTQSGANIDWTRGSADPANVLGGNTTIGFTIYLNRVLDLAVLNQSPDDPTIYKDWESQISADQAESLRKRGTEFDLEYLYRIIVGEPQDAHNALLQGMSGNTSLTSDLGYITGIPCWIRIHDNMHYKVSVQSMNVNHVLFTPDMVPTLTTVDLQLARIPALGQGGIDPKQETQFAITIAQAIATVTGKS